VLSSEKQLEEAKGVKAEDVPNKSEEPINLSALP